MSGARERDAARPPGWIERLGAALAAPTRALAASETGAGSGRAPADLAMLILLGFVASRPLRLVEAGWLAASGFAADGLHMVLADLSGALLAPLVFVMLGGAAVGLMAGRHRSLGADFDLACVAAVPLAAVPPLLELARRLGLSSAALFGAASWGCYAWGAALLVLAVRQARRRALPGVVSAPASGAARDSARARWAGRALMAVIAAVFAIDAAAVSRDWTRLRPVGSGGPAPGFELPRIDGQGRVGPERTSLASLRGRVVVIDFWETWCQPCRVSMPAVERVVARHERDDVALLSVCSDGTRKPLEAREIVDHLAPHATLLADDGEVADRYGVGTIPYLVVIGRDGSVVRVHRRFAGAAGLDRDLEAAIREALAPP